MIPDLLLANTKPASFSHSTSLKYFLICLVSLYFNVCPVLILGYTYSLVFIARAVNDLGNVSRARMRKSETGNIKTGPQA